MESISGKIGENNIFPFVGMERLHFMKGLFLKFNKDQ